MIDGKSDKILFQVQVRYGGELGVRPFQILAHNEAEAINRVHARPLGRYGLGFGKSDIISILPIASIEVVRGRYA